MASSPLANADTMNAPWGLASRYKLVVLACGFFSATKLADSHASVGKQVPSGGNPSPLTVEDFLKYLDVVDAFPKTPNALRVAQILERMASTGVLVLAGHGDRGFGGLRNHYLHMPLESEAPRGVNGGAKLVHPGGAKLVHLTLCGTRCWGGCPGSPEEGPTGSTIAPAVKQVFLGISAVFGFG